MKHLFNTSNSPDPYAVLATFFGREDMAYYRRVLQGALCYVHLPKVYMEVTPSSLIATLNDLAELIDIAYNISNDYKRSEVIVDTAEIDSDNTSFETFNRDYFPLFLSEKELRNPYKVLKKFFRIQTPEQWKKDLYTILDFALCRSDEGCELNTLFTYVQLVKFLEALYLIDARTRKV
jgi:hypothetical protein